MSEVLSVIVTTISGILLLLVPVFVKWLSNKLNLSKAQSKQIEKHIVEAGKKVEKTLTDELQNGKINKTYERLKKLDEKIEIINQKVEARCPHGK